MVTPYGSLLVSNPRLDTLRIDDKVETRQIACTIAKSLDIDCDRLKKAGNARRREQNVAKQFK